MVPVVWLKTQFGSFKEQTYYTVDFTCQIPVQLNTGPWTCIIVYGDKSKISEDFNRNHSEFFSANIFINNMGYLLYSYITYDWSEADMFEGFYELY